MMCLSKQEKKTKNKAVKKDAGRVIQTHP